MQVNNQRLAPGELCVLHDGDSVRFGMCVRAHCNWPHVEVGYILGLGHSYIFRSFIEHPPPGLSASDERLRKRLEALEWLKVNVEEERARLEQQLKDIAEESSQM